LLDRTIFYYYNSRVFLELIHKYAYAYIHVEVENVLIILYFMFLASLVLVLVLWLLTPCLHPAHVTTLTILVLAHLFTRAHDLVNEQQLRGKNGGQM